MTMNKKQFLDQLNSLLKGISLEERKEILKDYEDHFTFGIGAGESEETIATSLGTPRQISKEILTMYHLDKAEDSSTLGNVMRAVWAAFGLGFFNLVVVLGPILAIAFVALAVWVVGVGFTISPLLVLISSLFYTSTFEWFEFLVSVALSGVGILMTIGMYFATQALAKGFVRYLKFNVKLVKGVTKNEKY